MKRNWTEPQKPRKRFKPPRARHSVGSTHQRGTAIAKSAAPQECAIPASFEWKEEGRRTVSIGAYLTSSAPLPRVVLRGGESLDDYISLSEEDVLAVRVFCNQVDAYNALKVEFGAGKINLWQQKESCMSICLPHWHQYAISRDEFGDTERVSILEFREALITQGATPSYASPAWVANHFRWIVWKRASMERRAPGMHVGRWLTASQILTQLKHRYFTEYGVSACFFFSGYLSRVS